MSKYLLSGVRLLVYLAVFNMTLGELCAQVIPAEPAGPPEPQGQNGSLDLPLLKAHLAEKLDAGNKPTAPTASFPATAAWVHLMVQIKQDSPDGMVMITMYQAGKVEDKRIVEAKAGTRFVVSFYPLRADTFPVGHWWVTFKAGGQVLGSIPFTVGDPQSQPPATTTPTPAPVTTPATPATAATPATTPVAAPVSADEQPPEPGPPPTGLEPMPPLEPASQLDPEPPAPPILAALPAVPAGKQLVQATIGPNGGKVEVRGAVSLSFPAGALSTDERITIATGPAVAGARLYDVTRTGHGRMSQPVQVSLRVPEGVEPTDMLPLHAISEGMYEVPIFRYDEAQRLLVTEVDHFSAQGIIAWAVVATGVTAHAIISDAEGQQWGSRLTMVTGAFAGGALALKAIGGTIASVSGLGVVIVGVGVGVVAGYLAWEALFEAYQRIGLVGPLPAGKFNVYWDRDTFAGRPAVGVVASRQQRVILGFADPAQYSAAQRAQPISFPGMDGTYAWADLIFIQIPRDVLEVAHELDYADRWYAAKGFPTPPGPFRVQIMPLGPTYEGAFEMGALRLSSGLLLGSPEERRGFTGVVAHEYFHLLCRSNNWTEQRFIGAEDSLCVAFESLVFPMCDQYLKNDWGRVYHRLRNGLLSNGPDEDNTRGRPERRGYYLWPWTLYLGYTHGPVALREYATRTMSDATLVQRFRRFCYSLMASHIGLRDPVTVQMLNGRRVNARTGWSMNEPGRPLDNAANGTMGKREKQRRPSIPMGWYDLAPSCPLSFRLPVVNVPRQPRGTLVVRRDKPEPTEEFVALRPRPAGESWDVPDDLTAKDMVSMRGGVALRGAWVDSDQFKDALPVAVICTATTFETAPQAGNRLLSYRLNPPADIVFVKEPGKPATLGWTPPTTGCSASLTDCIMGYEVYGRTRAGGAKLVACLALPGQSFGYPALVGVEFFTVDPGQTVQDLPEDLVAGYVELGMQSVDRHLRYPEGARVKSDRSWSPPACAVALRPSSFEATPDEKLEFAATVDSAMPRGLRYKWHTRGQLTGDGQAVTQVQFPAEGQYTVTVTVLDVEGRRLGSATASGLVKKKEKANPKNEVWRLVRREEHSSQQERPHGEIAIAEATADCRYFNKLVGQEGRQMWHHHRYSWTVPPATLVPDQTLVFRVSAQTLVWEPGATEERCSVTVSYPFGPGNDWFQTAGDKAAVSREYKIKMPAGGGGFSLSIEGSGGWMSFRVIYVYEWVP